MSILQPDDQNDVLAVVHQDAADGVARLHVRGEIDMATVSTLERAMHAVMARGGVSTVLVDLAGVTFCDSSGIAALDRGYWDARKRGVAFGVANPQPAVRLVLELTGVLPLLLRT